MSQMERLYWFDYRVRAEQYPHWQWLVEQFEISRRTAMNDIAYLRDRLNAPLAFHNGRNGYYYTEPTYSLPFLALTGKEADALRHSLQTAGSYLPEGEAALVRELAVKLSPYLRGVPRHDGGAFDGNEVITGQVSLSSEALVSEELLRDVRAALDGRQRLDITYFGAHRGEMTRRCVLPYTLLNWRGELYLIAYCELRQAIRDFFLPRVREWALLPERSVFVVPETFSIQSYLTGAFLLQRGGERVTVRVRFSPRQAIWIRERRYHASQENSSEPDGSLIVTLRVALTEDLTRWILGYGAEAEVLEPVSLREAICEQLVRLQKSYAL